MFNKSDYQSKPMSSHLTYEDILAQEKVEETGG
jgi:hypothetical protein